MMTLFNYLIHTAYLLALLWLVYAAVLRNLSRFVLNRSFLVLGLLLAMFAPVWPEVAPGVMEEVPALLFPEILISPTGEVGGALPWMQHLGLLYSGGLLFFFLRYLIRLSHTLWLIRNAEPVATGISHLRSLNGIGGAFTFFNRILLDEQHIAPEVRPAILRHEMVHLRQWHSVDILLIDLILILQWFNPFAYMLKKEMQQVHEFLADRESLRTEERPGEYLRALQSYVFSNEHTMKISAAFGNVSLKRRLTMMTKIQRRGMLLRYGAASVMMVCCFLLLPAVNLTENVAAAGLENVQAVPTAEMQEKNIPPYKLAPQYPGGESALMTYLGSAVKYPEEARKKGTTGTVYVSFVVSKKGEVKNARVIRGVGDGCDEAALTAVQGMQRWTPGLNHQDQPIDVEITIPVKFDLSEKKAKE